MAGNQAAEVVVAGHICLDIIPQLDDRISGLNSLLVPGKLVNVGPAMQSTGGTVSNTGLALHRLGLSTRLMGKVSDDLFGHAIREIVRGYGGETLAEGMIVKPGEASSYSIVISPPGVDRIFLHCTGTNDTFGADDIAYDSLHHSRLFHFGYPPLMRRMYLNEGEELKTILSRVKQQGLTTTLDTAKPDPESEAGKVNWRQILLNVLPHVDVFFPSVDELIYMLDRELFDQVQHQPADQFITSALLGHLSDQLLDMGAAIVAIKLGEHGLYLRTTSNRDRLAAMGACTPEQLDVWENRELLAPVFQVEVVGTTGAGDCTIAGFLAGLLKGLTPEEVLKSATGVGACNVERADATSGIPDWATLQARIAAGWQHREMELSMPGWEQNGHDALWVGPNNK